MKKFSRKWVVMKIESQMDVVTLNFSKKLLGISWLREFSGENYCQVNSCIAILTTPVAGVSLVCCNTRPPVM